MNDLTPKEQYDARKSEKEAARASQGKADRGARRAGRLFWVVIVIAVLAALSYWIWTVVKNNSPRGADLSKAYAIVGRNHIAVGAPHEPYNSNPPTSGPHYDTPARVGFYEKQFPDERIIHNLEHGDVWISYRADVATSTREALRQFTNSPKVIMTLRPENEWDIALAAWGRLDGFNIRGEAISSEELQRVKDFVLRYQNKGPERVINSGAHLPN